MSELTAEHVDKVAKYCLFTDEEIPNIQEENVMLAQAVMMHLGFHKERLKEKRGEIIAMFAELPHLFFKSTGGGWSFLHACDREDGTHWGEHRDIDILLALGLASGLVVFNFPRDYWTSLPGGMPYFTVSDEANLHLPKEDPTKDCGPKE